MRENRGNYDCPCLKTPFFTNGTVALPFILGNLASFCGSQIEFLFYSSVKYSIIMYMSGWQNVTYWHLCCGPGIRTMTNQL